MQQRRAEARLRNSFASPLFAIHELYSLCWELRIGIPIPAIEPRLENKDRAYQKKIHGGAFSRLRLG
jgi:hypothetical protein